ncbi:cyanophycinase [Pseudoalteromonas sp. Z9A5]|uniref:cyanophycinase n=1 Tax=Pseudoalteromonas sp. Z9A5 TaxID=2686355 RepID=UPI0014086D50|nr:cyanophycinase [Pseudoalteromonas sp. Z9A5]
MICGFLRDQKPKLLSALVALLSTGFSISAVAQEQSQTLVLVGSELKTCASVNPENCQEESILKGKLHNLYTVNDPQIKNIMQHWPTNNETKTEVLTTLKAIQFKQSKNISKTDLLWLWRDINNQQLENLSDQEYNFIFDMLETPLLNKNNKRIKAQANNEFNNETATNNILQFVSGSLKVNSKAPTMMVITAASRDPYAAADLVQAQLSLPNINTQWLALTPALAKAITSNSCDNLPALRNTLMNVYNRDAIYPDLTQAELTLCKNGSDALVSLIKNTTGVMFNDGDADLMRSVLFDQNNKPYPWTKALQSRPVIVSTGAGTAIQSGGNIIDDNESANSKNTVAMITGGKSLIALRDGMIKPKIDKANVDSEVTDTERLVYNLAGGLGSFNYGVLDTEFSEQNRTFRLASLLSKTNADNSVKQNGFGIDENTALVVIKSPGGNLMTVIGKSGVVHLTSNNEGKTEGKTKTSSKKYSYSYWPAGSVIDITNNEYTLSQRTINQALPSIKIPPLPVQRFGTILTNSKLRSLTQAMCLSQEQSVVAQQDEFIISLTATKNTDYYRVNVREFGCAVSNLDLAVSTF